MLRRLKRPLFGASVLAGSLIGFGLLYQKLTTPQPPKFLKEIELPTRSEHLLSLQKKKYDVVVIGGGATGSGIALDAVTRGLSVALIEKEDFASGTSSRSTKLVHGGIRYLEKAVKQLDISQLSLVWEALFERRQLLSNAPHLTSVMPIITPCFSYWELPYYWFGLQLYDLVSGTSKLSLRVRSLSPKETIREFPMITRNKLKGSILYSDGQMNDSRLNVSLALTAAKYGANIANHLEVISVLKESIEPDAKAIGVKVRDTLTGDEFDVIGKVIVNATGPYVDLIRHLDSPSLPQLVIPSSGVHIVLPDYFSPIGIGMVIPKTKDGRVVFSLPWEGYTVAGTTDNPTELSFNPQPTQQEIDFIIETLRPYLQLPVESSDVLSAWSGIRPLALDPTKDSTGTENVVRDHLITVSPSGMITITGGKWTTYRLMAEQAVDKCIEVGKYTTNPKKCQTHALRLIGASKYNPLDYTQIIKNYKREYIDSNGNKVIKGYHSDIALHLSHDYGDRAYEVCRLASSGHGRRLVPGHPYLEAEVVYSLQNEYGLTAIDILARRTRLAFLSYDDSIKALPRVVELVGNHHGWSESRKEEERVRTINFLDTMRVPLKEKRD